MTGSQLSTYLLTADRQMTFQLRLSAGTNFTQKVNMIAVGIGPSVDLSVLRQLTENVLSFTENQEGDFRGLSSGSQLQSQLTVVVLARILSRP